MEKCGSSEDFVHSFHSSSKTPFWISYFQTLIDHSALHHDILPQLQGEPFKNLNELTGKLPFNQIVITEDNKEIENKLLEGYISIQTEENKDSCLLIPAFSTEKRDISLPEVEFSVLGPKDSFVESIDSNINLVRKRLPDKNLTLKEFRVGSLSKTKIAVIYIEGIADPENVNTMIQRIRDIEYDHISDSAYINQMIEDNSNSPFPQLIDTERPDRVSAVLAEGKVAVLVDGSPTAITGPTTLIEFFHPLMTIF